MQTLKGASSRILRGDVSLRSAGEAVIGFFSRLYRQLDGWTLISLLIALLVAVPLAGRFVAGLFAKR